MQDRPDAYELLEALEIYLREELLPTVAPEERFKVRVAANVCAMLVRETQPMAPDRAGLEALAHEIRSGAWDERLPKLAASLREKVRAKLEIDHPGWAPPN
jgi:hypothetical protein